MAAGSAMIDAARDAWFADPLCPATKLLRGIESRGKMRDAQIEAIKTYLFLKIGCGNKPLWRLYSEGSFNRLSESDFADFNMTKHLYDAIVGDRGMAAVYEYLQSAEVDAAALLGRLRKDPSSVDPASFFKELLAGVDYTDYLFSLPMGAGKTYLMAAFIYLDLYFSLMDPDNNAFARNFVVFAPSGLKASVIPSLRTIRSFDPAWLFPDDVARQLRALVTFEVLDERKTTSGLNGVRNPNVQKIAVHQPYDDLVGLVLVTNAEKVILDRVITDDSGDLVLGEDPDEKTRTANDLRREIGKLPRLAVIIDEVHHAHSADIKLRAVVNSWALEGSDLCGVLGFSGTPYLPRKAKVMLGEEVGFKTGLIANTVYYYPLTSGIGNFLKRPEVRIVEGESDDIIADGVRKFLDRFGDVTYEDGTTAKLAVFCSSVARLEEEVYPLVSTLLSKRGLDASSLVLKYHRGGTGRHRYSVSSEWAAEFEALDTPLSEKRIILLVQIGKEGWDCRSLTGVILSQEGDCKKNMVLQTSCRCLREAGFQGSAAAQEALIVVNQGNAKHLEDQLCETQRTDLEAFQRGTPSERVDRHSRMKVLGLPPLEYRKFELTHETVKEVPRLADPAAAFDDIVRECRRDFAAESVEDFDFDAVRRRDAVVVGGVGTPITFRRWLHELTTEGGTPPEAMLAFVATEKGIERLRGVFDAVTVVENGLSFLSGDYDQELIRRRIRGAFYCRREVKIDLCDVGMVAHAELVREEGLVPVYGKPRAAFYPDEERERRILMADAGELSEQVREVARQLSAMGQPEVADLYIREHAGDESVFNTYQYIPYQFDSPFEEWFYRYVSGLQMIDDYGLQYFYNGDRSVADFRIDCFEQRDGHWRKVGKYTPDFLVTQLEGGTIGKTLIVETKGSGFLDEELFRLRRKFVEAFFVPKNDAAFGSPRFRYTIVSDKDSEMQVKRSFEAVLREYFGS